MDDELNKVRQQLAAVMETKASEINDDNIRLVERLTTVRMN